MANQVKVNPKDLYVLINYESKWNPQAANPRSSAKGLIQFTDSTARKLGYNSSYELIEQNPTIESQLLNPVLTYLKKGMPYASTQELFMQVFYPKARKWALNVQFPDNVQRNNPGIKTPYDYLQRAYRASRLTFFPPIIIFLTGGLIFYLLNLRKGGKNERKNEQKAG